MARRLVLGRVIPLLRDAGVEARAIDLPGHGDDPGPFGDLHSDAVRVRREIDRIGGSVVLVGHSYGGAVITEAGDHDGVDLIVFVVAFPLDTGESPMSVVLTVGETALYPEGQAILADGFIVGAGESIALAATVAATCFYNDCDEDTTAWALSRLGAHPNVAFVQEPDAVAWRQRPSTYAVCTEDRAVHPEIQRFLARRCTSSVEWPTGHSPFLSRPELVARLVADRGHDPA